MVLSSMSQFNFIYSYVGYIKVLSILQKHNGHIVVENTVLFPFLWPSWSIRVDLEHTRALEEVDHVMKPAWDSFTAFSVHTVSPDAVKRTQLLVRFKHTPNLWSVTLEKWQIWLKVLHFTALLWACLWKTTKLCCSRQRIKWKTVFLYLYFDPHRQQQHHNSPKNITLFQP